MMGRSTEKTASEETQNIKPVLGPVCQDKQMKGCILLSFLLDNSA